MLLRTTRISASSNYRNLKAFFAYCAIAGCTLMISACASWLPDAHRLDLQQGNTIKLKQLETIEIGMTKSEIRQIMGSPMLSDPFHSDRWDYIYLFIPNTVETAH